MQAHHSKNDPVQWRPKKGPTAPEWAALPPVSPGGSYSGTYVLPMELGPPSGIAHRPVDMGALEPRIHWRHNSLPLVQFRDSDSSRCCAVAQHRIDTFGKV